MSYSRWSGLALVALIVTLSLSVSIGSSDEKPKPTTLRVLVSEKRAEIHINGVESDKKKGREREIVAPALKDGKKEYEVTAIWLPNNYTKFIRTVKVAPKPGETVVVDLRKEDPKNPDKIEIRFVPTPEDVVDRMCKLAKVTKDDVVYDLGCGDGRIVIAAVKNHGAKKGVGVDLDPELVKESTRNAKEQKLSDKLEFRVQDVLKIKDLSNATVVMLYMGDDVNERLKPILQKTLKPGARIVSHRFLMGDWKPEKTDKFEAADGEEYELHLWTIKAK